VDAQQCNVPGRNDNVGSQSTFVDLIKDRYSSAGEKGTIRITSPGAYVLPYTVQITDVVCIEVSGSPGLPHG
jgi:hypothetical protein